MHHARFVHLHCHTEYSLLDGAIRLNDLFAKAVEHKLPAVAVTDHGAMYGTVEFYKGAVKAGLKPIIGCEIYIAPGSRFDRRPDERGETNFHLILLARNGEGYRNLCRLVTLGYTEGFYYKPRIDKECLREHAEGLIGLSACLKGEVPRAILRGDREGARRLAREYRDIFGDGNYYLELMENGIPEQATVNQGLMELGAELDIPLVATNDCHYLERTDAPSHEVLVCVQTGKTLDDEKRMKMSTDAFYLRSPEEMAEAFAHCPEAIENTVRIAERCNVEIDLDTYHFPQYETQEGESLADCLDRLSRDGLEKRLQDFHFDDDAHRERVIAQYRQRLETELQVIRDMGFPGYFLIVQDFINWSKENGVAVGPGRGSAAGSLVAYALRITDIDPIPYDLLFERFLNPERVSMPDIDVDFCFENRDKAIHYVTEKYGDDQVAQISTFGKMLARAVIRDVGRVMGLSYGEVDRIAKLVPAKLGITLKEAIDEEPRLREAMEQDPKVAELIEHALRLEGLNRHASTHAAGIVIANRPLVDYLPLYKDKEQKTVTQFGMKGVESIGLIKFDFLGLKTLTVIADAVRIANEHLPSEEALDVDRLPMDDPGVYDLLSKGETTGVFQLESAGMKELMIKLRPSTFEDIIALVALYRPGPLGSGMVDDFIRRKHGEIPIEYELPELEPILKDTYGVIVYQEQVMKIAQVLADYTLGEADLLRRAMGKKIIAEMEKQKTRFLEGAREKNIDPKKAEKIFDLMAKFAEYGFNKCVVGSTRIADARTGDRTTVGQLHERWRRGSRDFVVHALGEDWKLHPRRVTDVVSNGKRDVYRLRTRLGKEIVATGNHPFRTLEAWVNLEDLATGDLIAAPRTMPLESRDSWPRHQLTALAHLLSEGNLCHPTSLYVYSASEELVADFAAAADQFPRSVARIDRRRKTLEVCVNKGRENSGPGVSGLSEWVRSLDLHGRRALEKSIPRAVFSLCDDDVAFFLGRLWSGDGYLCGSPGAKPQVPYYATSSRELARDVQELLLRLGIVSRVTRKGFPYRGTVKVGFTVHLLGEGVHRFVEKVAPACVGRSQEVARLRERLVAGRGGTSGDLIPQEIKFRVRAAKEAEVLTWRELEQSSGLSMKEFYGGMHAHKRGFRRDTVARLGETLGSPELRCLAGSDVVWDRIVSIEHAGVEETFDLTVETDHNFVADGLVVHNSHSAAYALVSYQTAYLKAHYPVAFMAALLTNDRNNTDKVVKNIAECRDMGIPVLPPDVNESDLFFTAVGDEIRFGLAAVKNVGEGALHNVLAVREEGGPFLGLADFCERVDLHKVNRKVIESLVACGAFDSLGGNRAQYLDYLDQALERAAGIQKDRARGQTNLFSLFSESEDGESLGSRDELADLPPLPLVEQLRAEKSVLGMFLTGHPLGEWEALLETYTDGNLVDILERPDKSTVTVGGMAASLKPIYTRTGNRMGFALLEDMHGAVEVVVFAELFARVEDLLQADDPLVVRGKLEKTEDSAKILAEEILPLADAPERLTESVHIHINAGIHSSGDLTALRRLLSESEYRGDVPGFLHILIPDKSETVIRLPSTLALRACGDLKKAVGGLIGNDAAVSFR